jgi:alpha-L-rhamnosidase
MVSSSWAVKGRNFHLEIEIPVNTTARVYVPAAEKESVKEGGRQAVEVRGIKFLGMKNEYEVLAVGSGVYSFDSIR